MRENYTNYGVDGYYNSVRESYRNPHFDGIVDTTIHLLNSWYNLQSTPPTRLHLLDLACGSGEATLAAQLWLRHNSAALHLTSGVDSNGENSTMIQLNETMRPCPQFVRVCKRPRIISASSKPTADVFSLDILACDPFTRDAYRQRTGLEAHDFSFADIAQGCLSDMEAVGDELQLFDTCICSFAAHLIPESMLYAVFYQLATHSRHLIILSPHKRPQLTEAMGWQLMESMVGDQRVHGRLFKSILI